MSLKKSAKRETPHATYRNESGWEWRVLRVYQKPEAEHVNQYARWFCFVTSPMCPEGEFGDTYVRDVTGWARLDACSAEWGAAYGRGDKVAA